MAKSNVHTSDEKDYVLAYDTGLRGEHFANLDDGRITWTPHLKNSGHAKGKPKIAHDRVATILTLPRAVALKRSFCNPGGVKIGRAV